VKKGLVLFFVLVLPSVLLAGNGLEFRTLRFQRGAEVQEVKFPEDVYLGVGCRTDTGAVDIVFVVDVTGSMSGEIRGVVENMSDFVDTMDSYGYEYAFGLVVFGDTVYFRHGYELTTSPDTIHSWIAALTSSGGGDFPEVSADAIDSALAAYHWRPGALKVIIMITDASFHYRGDGRPYSHVLPEEVLEDILDAGAVVFIVSEDRDRTGDYCFDWYMTFCDSSGGNWFLLGTPFFSILDSIADRMGEFTLISALLMNSTPDTLDTVGAMLFPGSCIEILYGDNPQFRYDVAPGDFIDITWRMNVLCTGPEDCFRIVAYSGDYSDDVSGCLHFGDDCQCVGPVPEIIYPPDGTITACDDQGFVATIVDDRDELDVGTIQVEVNGVRYLYPENLVFSNDTLYFTPDTSWEHGDTVSYAVVGGDDFDGCEMEDFDEGYFVVDLLPPVISGTFPADGELIVDTLLVVGFDVADDIAGVNLDSVYITVNGVDYHIDSPEVAYTGDESGGHFVFSAPVFDIISSPVDTIFIAAHSADNVSTEFCGPNISEPVDWVLFVNFVTVDISAPTIRATAGESIDVPVTATTTAGWGVDSVTFALEFDPQVLSIDTVSFAGTAMEGFSIVSYLADNASGVIEFTATGDGFSIPSPETTLVYLLFNVNSAARGGMFSNLDFVDVIFGQGLPETVYHNGFVYVDWNVISWMKDIIVNREESPGVDVVLTFGASPSATDGYDPEVDIIQLPPVPSAVNAYFEINDPENPLFHEFSRDIRCDTCGFPVVWHIRTWDEPSGILSWTTDGFPEGDFLLANSVDMRRTSEYHFGLNEDITIAWDQPAISDDRVSLKAGWNMVSLPRLPTVNDWELLFPDLMSDVWTFDPTTRTYGTAGYPERGKGYWMLSGEDTTYTIAGMEIPFYQIALPAGWNMVGTIYDTVSLGEISADPPEAICTPYVFWYNPSTRGYDMDTKLVPGKGYWVLLSEDAVLTVPGDGGYMKQAPCPDWVASLSCDEEEFMFGYSASSSSGLDALDIPIPPDAPEDASSPAIFSSTELTRLSRDIKPVNNWEFSFAGGNLEYSLPAGMEFVIVSPNGEKMSIRGEGTLDSLPGGFWRIRAVEEVSKGFKLFPPVPNPFNSEVQISWNQPGSGDVTVTIYDILGRTVRKEPFSAHSGRNSIVWDGRDENGSCVPSGLYFYTVKFAGNRKTGRMLLLK